MKLGPAVPLLRSFDEARTRAFYVDYLGFAVDWEHRFEDGLPLYMQLSRDGCVLHLTEHHGDCTPGAALRIAVADIDAFAADLARRHHPGARPHIETMPWGTRDLRVTDPHGNRLVFTDAISV